MQHEKVEQFVAFCEGIHPDTEYNWDDAGVCALGQFCNYEQYGWEDYDFETCNRIAHIYPQTFGALTERLKLEFNFI